MADDPAAHQVQRFGDPASHSCDLPAVSVYLENKRKCIHVILTSIDRFRNQKQ